MPAAASEIKLIVNRVPVTTYDIQRRVAFLKLQRRKGNLNAEAEQAMVDQALHNAEAQRLGVRITDDAVTEAYNRFAKGNKMTVKQLDGIMSQSGVTKAHFKEFIRSQMAWNQALAARNRSEVRSMSEQDVVQKMLAQGGKKPSTTEYTLQQVIFVVPPDERGSLLSRRKREAEGMRSRLQGCERTYDIAKQLVDVTVRDLGRVAAPELPPRWKDAIENAKAGKTTPVQETERGAEFIAVCNTRQISDDKSAAMVFRAQELEKLGKGESGPDKALLDKLRKNARIVRK